MRGGAGRDAEAVRVGAKVVLVGEHRQLPEVAAGVVFSAAQAALDQLRHGDVAQTFMGSDLVGDGSLDLPTSTV